MPIAEIAAGLRDHVAAAAVAILGKPTVRTMRELRWGSNGKLAVVLAGPKAGTWFDHSSGEGGDILTLAQREMGRAGGLEWAKAWLGLAGKVNPAPRSAPRIPPSDNAAKMIASARALVDRSRPVKDIIAERYLASRGLVLPDDPGLFDPGSLRFVPDCWHWPSQSRLPALVAPVTGIATGALQGLHLTFLAADGAGKAPSWTNRACITAPPRPADALGSPAMPT